MLDRQQHSCRVVNDTNLILVNSVNLEIIPNIRCNMKYADINPADEKGDYTDKDNYIPVSLRPVVSKVFERLIHKDISSFMEKHLSNRLRKSHSAQLSLIVMLKK